MNRTRNDGFQGPDGNPPPSTTAAASFLNFGQSYSLPSVMPCHAFPLHSGGELPYYYYLTYSLSPLTSINLRRL